MFIDHISIANPNSNAKAVEEAWKLTLVQINVILKQNNCGSISMQKLGNHDALRSSVKSAFIEMSSKIKQVKL